MLIKSWGLVKEDFDFSEKCVPNHGTNNIAVKGTEHQNDGATTTDQYVNNLHMILQASCLLASCQ